MASNLPRPQIHWGPQSLPQYFCQARLCRTSLFTKAIHQKAIDSRNTSAQLVNSLYLWGPTTPDTTQWERYMFTWDSSWRPIIRMIILQKECGPSLSVLSKPWTPTARQPPQEILPSAISPGSPSSYSSAQVNNAEVVPTPPSTPACSKTPNSSLESNPTTPQWRPTPWSPMPTYVRSALWSNPKWKVNKT